MASLPHIPQQSKDEQAMTSSNPLANEPALDVSAGAHPNPILASGKHDEFDLPPPVPQAPHLRTPLASESADQWASNTLNAVSGEQSGVTPASNVSTPGPNIPGAFPTGLPLPSKETVEADVAAVKDAAVAALVTAKDYIVAGGQKLYPYVNAAGQTVYSNTQVAGQKAAEGTSGAGQAVVEGAGVAGQKVAEAAAAVPPAISGGAQKAGETVASGAATARDTATSGAVAAKDTVVGGGVAAKDTVVGGSLAAKDTAVSGASTAGQTVSSGVVMTGQTVSSGASTVSERVYSMAEMAGDKVAPYLPAAVASYLPHHVENNTDHIKHSTAITDPTGNPKNGLEALDGTSFAKLPEEAQQREPTVFSTGNPNNGLAGVSGDGLAKLPEERKVESNASKADSTSSSTNFLKVNEAAAPPPTVFESANTHLPLSKDGADGDASTKTLHGSLLSDVGSTGEKKEDNDRHRGTAESKPLNEDNRSQGDSHLETLREHDAAAKSHSKGVTDTLVSSVKDKEKKYHGNVEDGIGHEPTVSKSAGERDPIGTGANKPVNGAAREHALGAPDSKYQREQGPPVPEKNDISALRGDSTTATTGHSTTHRGHSADSPNRVAIDQKSAHTAKDRASGGSFGSEGSGKRSGFMSKVKGEMKVLSGKMTGKEEKVEEGRRLMGKN